MRFAKPPRGACACECECLLAVASITPRSGGLHGSPRFLFFYDIRYNYNNIIIYNIAHGHTNTFFLYIRYGGTYIRYCKIYDIEVGIIPTRVYCIRASTRLIHYNTRGANAEHHKLLPRRNRARRVLRKYREGGDIWRRGFEQETNYIVVRITRTSRDWTFKSQESCWSKFKKNNANK